MRRIKWITIILLISLFFFSTCTKVDRTNPFDDKANLNPDQWAPFNFRIDTVTSDAITLSWDYLDKNIEGFKIERRVNAGEWVSFDEIITKDLRHFTYKPPIINNSTTFEYTIYAIANTNQSGKDSALIVFDLPIVSTTQVTDITQNSALSGGNVISDGGLEITEKGVCWSTNSNPTIADNHTSDGIGTGSFISSITGLNANTQCYVRTYATNSLGTAYGNEISFSTTAFSIGQNYGGGIIFYINETSQHGLISSTSDQSGSAHWGCSGTFLSGTSLDIGTGQNNSTIILNGCAQDVIAASICDALILNGYNDWFLPSRDELNLLYDYRSIIGGFDITQESYYWCSSEYDSNQAWATHFSTGTLFGYYTKDRLCRVRAIRSF